MTDPLAGVTYRPIGLIRTPFTDPHGMPIQASAAVGVRGRVELDLALVEGLADIEGFSHLILLYHLHEVVAARLTVIPFLDDRPHRGRGRRLSGQAPRRDAGRSGRG